MEEWRHAADGRAVLHLSAVVDIWEVLVPGERSREGDLLVAGHGVRCSPCALSLCEVLSSLLKSQLPNIKREGGNASRLAAWLSSRSVEMIRTQ